MKDQERLIALESQLVTLISAQKEFTAKALQMLALGTKTIYSKEEAALFLNLDPAYLYQLKHHGKLKAYKKKGQKKIYFKKEDLESYLLNEAVQEIEDDGYDDFEQEILDKWKK
ncbi:helix-turn-helix domain-containing protein [Chryseobacterium rhizoplanae]|uniref:helix-turn-helix domain-containing protein n=1 Tax=Chryseobacterium rhizoplanae TaxID=1609531 RepID=UPI001CE2B7A8|nr:helix-turn-helix domain-containing protein [Chryseobacterium rhizoplanae]UCA58257.1 helix-turn-helix domain-containing protein [Chryseobacterium rhizoplanae]